MQVHVEQGGSWGESVGMLAGNLFGWIGKRCHLGQRGQNGESTVANLGIIPSKGKDCLRPGTSTDKITLLQNIVAPAQNRVSLRSSRVLHRLSLTTEAEANTELYECSDGAALSL
jgi:hypothetical protein